MATPKELTEPDLRATWSAAKKAAEKKAKTKKQDKIYGPLKKQFSQDLGPQLKKWPNEYPNIGAMDTKLAPITRVIAQYKKLIVAEKKLDRSVKSTLTSALDEISTALDERLEKAKELILGDEDLAMKQAIKESKNPVTPIEILSHPDISSLVMAKATSSDAVKIAPFKLQILLTDDEALTKLSADDGNARYRMQDAANFDQVITEIAGFLSKLDKAVAANPDKFDAADKKFAAGVEKILKDATDRSSDELHRLVGVRVQYRNYKIKSGVKLTLAIAGTVGGAISLGLAPFAPVMLVNAVGVIKGAVAIGEEIGKLSLTAEEMANSLRKDVDGLVERYKGWPGFDVGSVEVGVTLVNAITPTFFKTISSCGDDLGRLDAKIAGLEVQASDLSVKLNEILDEQTKFETYLKGWLKKSKTGISPEIKFAIVALKTQLKSNRGAVMAMIEKITSLNGRVDNTRGDLKDFAGKVAMLSTKEPTLAKFAEVFINTSANVGFLVSGNVGWEDAYKIAESTKAVTDMIGNVSGSVDGALSLAEDLKGLVDEVRAG